MGNLFYRRQPISEITRLTFSQAKMWNEWHELMANEEAKMKCHKCGNTYDIRKYKKCPACGE